MCVNALAAYICVYYMYVLSLQKPESGVRSSATGSRSVACKLSCECWEQTAHLQEEQVLLSIDPSLQPYLIAFIKALAILDLRSSV